MALEKKLDGQPDQTTQNQTPDSTAPQTLAGSTQTGRISAFSSGQAPQTAGSGRFTNLSKYISANQNASGNLGAKANQTVNKEFGQQQAGVTKQNEDIQKAFQQGKTTLQQGQGFQNQLGQIGQGFQSGFQDFTNRGDAFNTAGQQAQTLAGNQDYSNIASGQGINEQQLAQSQGLAQTMSQDLLNKARQGVQNIETEQGRDQLFSQVLQPKQGYSQGQRSFDKLFLGGALGGIRSNLQSNQAAANALLNTTAGQQAGVTDLTNQEAELLKGLTGQATKNQDLFNTALYGSATATDPQGNLARNLAQVNAARLQNYNNLVGNIKSGSISQADAEALGLTDTNTFINQNQPTSALSSVSQKVSAPEMQAQKNLIGTYNILKDPTSLNKYIQQGQDAASARDITTQADYDVYKALQGLAGGRDTGMTSGISGLGSSIKRTGDLAADIAAQDKAFRDQYAGRTFSGTGTDVYYNAPRTTLGKDLSQANQINNAYNNYVNNVLNTMGNAQIGERGVDTAGLSNAIEAGRQTNYSGTRMSGSGAAAVNNTIIDDYIRNNQLAATQGDKAYDDGGSAGTAATNIANAQARAEENVRNLLNQTISDTGVKNALAVDTSKTNELKKRFGSLV